MRITESLPVFLMVIVSQINIPWLMADNRPAATTVSKATADFSKYNCVFVQGANPLEQMPDSNRVRRTYAEAGYGEGEISLLDFLDSQRTYNSVLGDYHQALYDWNDAMAALEKAAGGPVR